MTLYIGYPNNANNKLLKCASEFGKVVVVQSLGHVWLFMTPQTVACQTLLSSTVSHSLLKFMSVESVMLSNYFILCCPLLLLLSIFPSITSFLVSRLFTSGGQSTGASGSASVLPMNIQGWFPVELTSLISLQSRELSRVFSSTTIESINSLALSLLYGSALTPIHDYWKNHSFDYSDLCQQDDVSVFYMLFRFVITFLLRSKRLLISWLQSSFEVILEPKKKKSVIASNFSPSLCHEVMGLSAKILVFWMLSFNPAFSLSFFTLIKRLFSSSSLSAVRVVSPAYLRLLIFLPAILISACDSSSPAGHIMFSAYKLNKQGENIQPYHTPFPILNQSVVPRLVLLLLDLHTGFSGGRVKLQKYVANLYTNNKLTRRN